MSCSIWLAFFFMAALFALFVFYFKIMLIMPCDKYMQPYFVPR